MESVLSTELLEKFPCISPRPAVECPAFNCPQECILDLMAYLRDEKKFDLLCDVTAVDWDEGASPRFSVVYNLLSTVSHESVRVVSDCIGDETPVARSVVSLWAAANWHERETWDLMGVRFEGHPDLRRILMWEGYPWHPLRKEFPLAGKACDFPAADVAESSGVKVIAAPMAGGPFRSVPGKVMSESEPRARDESWSEENPRGDQ